MSLHKLTEAVLNTYIPQGVTLLERLTNPASAVTGRSMRERARLLAALSLACLVFHAFGIVLIVAIFGLGTFATWMLVSAGVWALVYGLSRSAYHAIGRGVLLGVLCGGTFL